MDLDPGTVVAHRYRIARPLGRGGMGEVFAAENIRTGRPVAIKLLRQDSKTKATAIARFRQEARAAGSINSDHVTQVLDVEDDEEHGVVLVFELLEGESLIDRLKRTGAIPFEELWPIIEQVWLGLADAHRANIIHRDLKPSNVFLERRPDGSTRVKILDFGISKVPKEVGGETLTEMGQSLGTFSFMPPEQIGKAKTVDHRADIYACATLIYQSLTAQLPYNARNILVMVEMKSKTDARKLSEAMNGPVDPRLEAFVARGLERDPAMRFQTAVEALAAWRDLRPAPASGGQVQAPGSGPAPLAPGSFSSGPGATSARGSHDGGSRPQTPGSRPPPAYPQSSQSSLGFTPGPVIIEKPGPLPRVNDVVDMTTEETAATLAMPRANLRKGSSAMGTPPLAPRLNSAAASISTASGGTIPVIGQAQEAGPALGPGGTQLVKVPRARTEEGSTDDHSSKSGNLPVHPAGYYIPPAVAASLARVTPPQPGGSQPPPQRPVDDMSSLPASSDGGATQVYRPSRADETASRRMEPAAPVQPKRPISLVLVLLGCLLVSFAVVAGAMLLTRH